MVLFNIEEDDDGYDNGPDGMMTLTATKWKIITGHFPGPESKLEHFLQSSNKLQR